MQFWGSLWGLLFCVLALLSPLLYVVPLVILLAFDWLFGHISDLLHMTHSKVGLFSCIIMLILFTIYYVHPILSRHVFLTRRLIIFLLGLYLFVHLGMLYGSQYDPNEGFNMLRFAILPTQTFWMFVLVGILHDILKSTMK